MSDPSGLTDSLEAARDAFRHAHGVPTFEPTINAHADADDGEVQIQKACRLLEAATVLQQSGDYYGSILEHSFAAVERTLEGYLIAFTDCKIGDFHDHTTVYKRQRQVPLTAATLETLEALYVDRRTEHYYGTTVTTKRQAEAMFEVATGLHEYIVQFDQRLTQYCNCSET